MHPLRQEIFPSFVHATRRGIPWIFVGIAVVLVLAFSLAVIFTPANASESFAASLCGSGAPPDYGFTYELMQAHWTVDWQGYASQDAVNEVDMVLDRLNEDSIAQTMILIKPQDEVGDRVNCAVHFLRYMKLGLPDGERKDNGFVFLIVVEPARIDVHYGVGLGLPALTAPELTSLNRAAEEAYESSGSMDDALLALVNGFDTVARNKYSPLIQPTPTPVMIDLPEMPSGPLGILTACCMVCVGIIFLLFLVWLLIQLARLGATLSPSDWGSGGSGYPNGGGTWSSRGGGFGTPRSGGFGMPRSGGFGSSSRGGGISMPRRGGGGSGRSGRGN